MAKIGLSIGSIIFTLLSCEFLCYLLNSSGIDFSIFAHNSTQTQTTNQSPREIPHHFFSKQPHFAPTQTIMPSPPVPTVENFDYFDPTSKLTLLLPNYSSLVEKRFAAPSHKLIFNAQVTTDKYRRRIAQTPTALKKEKHLLVLGCSYVFGEGVSNEGTLPWQLNLLQKTYQAYNLGVPGYGPNDIMARLLTTPYLDGISQRHGLGVYLFMNNHMSRAMGSMSVYGDWGYVKPVIQENSDNTFTVLGSFNEVHPVLFFIYKILLKSNITIFFKLDFPIFQSSHYEKFARLIQGMEREYKQKTHPSNPFIFVFFPEKYHHQDINLNLLKKYLSAYNIHYIDYTNEPIQNLVNGPSFIDYDGHPTPASYKVLAEALVSDLKLLN